MDTKTLLYKIDTEYCNHIKKVYLEREGNLFYAVCILIDGTKEREVLYTPVNDNHRIDDIEAQMKEWNINPKKPGQSLFNFKMRAQHINLDID